MKRLNKKGFTLVELLAVIVILALLMVVAASSIGSALDNSRKKTLKIAAQKFLNDNYSDAQSKKLMNATVDSTVNIDKDDYTGSITFDSTTGNITAYCITISKYNIEVSAEGLDKDGVPTVGEPVEGKCS